MSPTAVVWFRRDLRLHDHPALVQAVAEFDRIVPLFVVDEHLLDGRWRSCNRTWHLARAVERLAEGLAQRGATLTVVRGDPRSAVIDLVRAVGAAAIVVTRDGGP